MSLKRVLFLCTGNSCRSQMAEAMVNHFLGDRWHADSAGTEPAGYVHPLALQVLAELNVPTDGLRSKSVLEFRQSQPHLVVTVCGDAAERCPVWLGQGRRLHVGFPDPAGADGSAEERMAIFREVRDAIRSQLISLLGADDGLAHSQTS